MDVIDFELKRYDSMQTDLENFKKSFDNLNDAPKDQSKSVDDLDTLMNEEKPKEVTHATNQMMCWTISTFHKINFCFSLDADGAATTTNS